MQHIVVAIVILMLKLSIILDFRTEISRLQVDTKSRRKLEVNSNILESVQNNMSKYPAAGLRITALFSHRGAHLCLTLQTLDPRNLSAAPLR